MNTIRTTERTAELRAIMDRYEAWRSDEANTKLSDAKFLNLLHSEAIPCTTTDLQEAQTLRLEDVMRGTVVPDDGIGVDDAAALVGVDTDTFRSWTMPSYRSRLKIEPPEGLPEIVRLNPQARGAKPALFSRQSVEDAAAWYKENRNESNR